MNGINQHSDNERSYKRATCKKVFYVTYHRYGERPIEFEFLRYGNALKSFYANSQGITNLVTVTLSMSSITTYAYDGMRMPSRVELCKLEGHPQYGVISRPFIHRIEE